MLLVPQRAAGQVQEHCFEVRFAHLDRVNLDAGLVERVEQRRQGTAATCLIVSVAARAVSRFAGLPIRRWRLCLQLLTDRSHPPVPIDPVVRLRLASKDSVNSFPTRWRAGNCCSSMGVHLAMSRLQRWSIARPGFHESCARVPFRAPNCAAASAPWRPEP